MKNYEYKNSGIEWLGDIPKHWTVNKIKNCFSVNPSNVDKKSYEDQAEVKLCNYVDVYYNDYIDKHPSKSNEAFCFRSESTPRACLPPAKRGGADKLKFGL